VRFEHAGRSTKDLVDTPFILVQAGVKPGDIVLDAGSGNGYLAIAASPIVGSAGKAYALDVDKASIASITQEISRLRLKNVFPLLADLTQRIPLEGERVDVCHMGSVLHGFVENHQEAPVMQELARVIKKGGKLVVVEFKKVQGPPGPPISVRLSPEQVNSLCANHGFKKTTHFEAGEYHYGVVFTREG